MSGMMTGDSFVVKRSSCFLYSDLTRHSILHSTVAVIWLPITEKGQNIISLASKLVVKTLFQKVYISPGSFVSNFFCYDWSQKPTYVVLTLLKVWMNLLGYLGFRLCILVVNLRRCSFGARSMCIVAFSLITVSGSVECAEANRLWTLLAWTTNTLHKVIC